MTTRMLLAGVSLWLLTGILHGQVTVQRAEGRTLTERLRSAPSDGRTWAGYAFRRLMEPDNYLATGWSSHGTLTPTRTLEHLLASAGDPESHPVKRGRMLRQADERTEKRVAVLMRISRGTATEIEYQTTDVAYDSSRVPLLWLGEADVHESSAFLRQQYVRSDERVTRERLVRLVGLHQTGEDVESVFLRDVLTKSEDAGIRRNAATALGEVPSIENLSALAACVREESSSKVARAAVWALGHQESDGAADTLIALLQQNSLGSVRREVLQAIANRAAERALPVLQDVIENDPDIDVRRMAVWSLANLSDGSGVPLLITLARSETSPSIRKAAIQALAQTKDERATQALIEIIRTQ